MANGKLMTTNVLRNGEYFWSNTIVFLLFIQYFYTKFSRSTKYTDLYKQLKQRLYMLKSQEARSTSMLRCQNASRQQTSRAELHSTVCEKKANLQEIEQTNQLYIG